MIKRYLVFCFMIFSFCGWTIENGEITGKLVDSISNASLPFTKVFIQGTSIGCMTDIEGEFILKDVNPGKYTLVFISMGYKKMMIDHVVVQGGETTQLLVALQPIVQELKGVVIRAEMNRATETALLEDQQEANVAKEAIGAKEMAKKGIDNVAEGVKQITGVSKREDKGLVVRGLSERYNYLTVNGLPIITGNPDKKIIPLTQFTTNIVRNITVFKTYNPALYGDFAGASINVVTKDIPKKLTTTITLGVSGNSQSTFSPFLLDKETTMPFLGWSSKGRKLPTAYDQSLVKLGKSSSPRKSAQLFTTDFKVKEIIAPINWSMRITHGNRFKLPNNQKIGYYIGLGYANKYQTNPSMSMARLDAQGGFISKYDEVQNHDLSTQQSALFSFMYEKENRVYIKINNIFLKNTSNFTQEQLGYNSEANDQFFSRLSRYRNTIVNQTQVLGSWMLSNDKRHQLNFGTSFGKGIYQEPDRKLLYANGYGGQASLYIANSSEPNRSYARLAIQDINGKVDYSLRLGKKDATDKYKHKITVGGDFNLLSYDYFNRVIKLNVNPIAFPNGVSHIEEIAFSTSNPDAYFKEGFDQQWLNYVDGSDAAKFSYIYQRTFGAFLSYDLQLNDWHIKIGGRGVYYRSIIYYKKPTSGVFDDYLVIKNKQPFTFIPSLNFKYKVNATSNLRFASSITQTKPRVREILPTRYLSGPFELVSGNPDLKNSTNYNIDAKYEWFPAPKTIFSITGFGKFIKNPIETVISPVAGGASFGFANTQEAIVYGVEFVLKSNFVYLLGWESLEGLNFGANATLMKSNVRIDKSAPKQKYLTNDNRSLQGAAPFIINADLSYDFALKKNWKSTVSLVYNVFGKRIYAVGGSNLDDTYQMPQNRLDLVWSNHWKRWALNLHIGNLLNSPVEIRQTPTGVKNAAPIQIMYYKQGIDFALSITLHL